MVADTQTLTSEVLARTLVEGLQEKKGIDVVLIDLRGVHNAFTDFFVICSGNSETQVDALRMSAEEFGYKRHKALPHRVEGQQNREWILMDYLDVVVHVFQKQKREFFGLEALWGDGKVIRFENMG
jgi:ribosome-associated protein